MIYSTCCHSGVFQPKGGEMPVCLNCHEWCKAKKEVDEDNSFDNNRENNLA